MDVPVLALIIVAGAAIAVTVPCIFFAFLYRRSHDNNLKSALPISAPDSSSSWSIYGSGVSGDAACLEKLSLADLAAATGGFSPGNIIGDGSFGFVYRAVLPGTGASVAVKRLSGDGAAGAGNREFRAEVEVLGSLSHPNLARLLGYCDAGRDRILVYELLERGSLDAWLHGGVEAGSDADGGEALLHWAARLRVARGAAAALAFLHHGRRPPVLHRNVKSSNVLLGDGFEAKLADFGLARIVRGSPAKSHVKI
ncbi:unnamed protein product [Urochloa humidicola]